MCCFLLLILSFLVLIFCKTKQKKVALVISSTSSGKALQERFSRSHRSSLRNDYLIIRFTHRLLARRIFTSHIYQPSLYIINAVSTKNSYSWWTHPRDTTNKN